MDDQNLQATANHASKPEIRKVTTEHGAQQLALLAREIWEEHYTPLIGAQQVAYMLTRYQSAEQIWQDISSKRMAYSQMELDGQTIGYMAAQLDLVRRTCFLSKIYIRKLYRGHGYARLFLDSLTTECRNNSVRQIWLTVNKGNLGSIAVYQTMGFHQDEAIVTDIGGGFVMDDYVMRLELGDDRIKAEMDKESSI